MAKTVLLRVKVDDRGNPVIDQLNRNLGRTTRTARGFTSQIKKIVTSLALFRGIQRATAYVGELTDDVLEFNKAFKQTQGIAEMSVNQIDQLKDATIDLANGLEHVTPNIAKTSLELAKMGIENVTDQISVIPKVADLATSGMVDMNKALEDSAQVSKAFFGDDMTQFTRVVDSMHGAVSATMIGFEDFVDAMKFIAPIAKTTGMSIEETSALIGKLGDVGIKGSLGGTTLKNTMLNMLRPAKAVREELAKMNTENMSLVEILAKLKKNGLNAIDFLDTFNLRAIAGTLALADMEGAVGDLNKKLDGHRYSVSRTAEVVRQSWSDQMAILGNVFRGVFIEFSRVFEDISTGGAFDSFKQFFIDIQLKIRENREELREWAQVFMDRVVKVLKWVVENRTVILGFFTALVSAKVLQGVGKLFRGLGSVYSSMTTINNTPTTGLQKWNSWMTTLTASVWLGVEAYKALSKVADAYGAKADAKSAGGGDITFKGYQNKIKALEEFLPLLKKRDEEIRKIESERGSWFKEKFIRNTDMNKGATNISLDSEMKKLADKYKLNEVFFKMADSTDKWAVMMKQLTFGLDKVKNTASDAVDTWESATMEKLLIKRQTKLGILNDEELEKAKGFGATIQGLKGGFKKDKEKERTDSSDFFKDAGFSDMMEQYGKSFREGLGVNEFPRLMTAALEQDPIDVELKAHFNLDALIAEATTFPPLPINGMNFEGGEEQIKFLKEYSNSLSEVIDHHDKFLDTKLDADVKMVESQKQLTAKMKELYKEQGDAVMFYVNSFQTIASKTSGYINAIQQTDNEATTNRLDKELSALTEKHNRAMKLAEGDNAKRRELDRQYAKDQEKIKREQEAARKAEAERNKNAAAFTAILNTAVAITGVLAQTPGGATPRLGAAAIIAAAGALEVATIYAKNYRFGGEVEGRGNSSSDSVLARLSVGERVLTADENRKLGGKSGISRMLDDDEYRLKTRKSEVHVHNPIGNAEHARRAFSSVQRQQERMYMNDV